MELVYMFLCVLKKEEGKESWRTAREEKTDVCECMMSNEDMLETGLCNILVQKSYCSTTDLKQLCNWYKNLHFI